MPNLVKMTIDGAEVNVQAGATVAAAILISALRLQAVRPGRIARPRLRNGYLL